MVALIVGPMPRDAIVLAIPVPPSVNGLWFNKPGKGRVRSDRYRTWLNSAGWLVQAQRPGHMPGRVEIEICLPERNGADLDNRVKATLDLLVAHRIIEGDNNKVVRRITVAWGNVADCRVTIRPAREPLIEAAA